MLKEHEQAPYNMAQCICVLLCLNTSDLCLSRGVEIRLPHRNLLETDQCTHDEQSDVIVLVIREEFCVAPWHNMVDCV